MRAQLTALAGALALLVLGVAGGDAKDHAPAARAPAPILIEPTDCTAHVAYDRDLTLPGYLLPTSAGPKTCIPFTTTAAHPPAGYHGEFYVDEFTDAKLR